MIYILGGSNSFIKGGWFDIFKTQTNRQLKNISIGGTGSITSAWRIIFTIDLKPGDTVIWEYAINDGALIRGSKYSEEICLKYCEFAIRHTQERGAKFLPIILTDLHNERAHIKTRYRRQLEHLFYSYDLEFLEISELARNTLGIDSLNETHYDDPMHYSIGGEVVHIISSGVLNMLNKENYPQKKENPIYSATGNRLRFHNKIRGADLTKFQNSLITVDINPILEPIFSMEPFGYKGKISSLIAKVGPNSGAIRLKVGERRVPLSLSIKPKYRPAIIPIGLAGLFEDNPIEFHEEQCVQFVKTEPTDLITSELEFTKTPDLNKKKPDFQLVGILTEEVI